MRTDTTGLRRHWEQMGLRTRLGGAFALVLLMTLACGLTGALALQRVHGASAALAQRWLPGINHLSHARAAMLAARDWEVKYSLASDDGYREEYEEKLQAAARDRQAALQAFTALPRIGTETALLKSYTEAWDAYEQAQRKVLELGRSGKQQDARDISDGAAKMSMDDAVTAVDKLLASDFEAGRAAGAASETVFGFARGALAGTVGAALVLSMLLATWIVRSVVRQLGGEPAQAADVASAVAAGDLTMPIALRQGDEHSLMAQLRRMQQALAAVVSTVRQSSQGLATATSEIAQGNSDLSGRTEHQASALQETAASMAQLRDAVGQNAENARQADALARRAQSIAGEGGEAVGRMMQTMREINEGARKVAEITSVIDGIAFQTNILALNAAVEAARAGEQGRGFTVVAGEVRNLAQRSAESAKQISALIADSVARVDQGTKIANQAGGTMQQVVQAIGDVAGLIGEISQASVTQSEGVRQVADAVSQMDQVTQQNAALVEQAAASAQSLREQADRLVDSVSVFRLQA